MELKLTLIGDGSSDKVIVNIIKWLLDDIYPTIPVKIEFADFGRIKNPPSKTSPNDQYITAKKYFPFDFLIYHRDAEIRDFDMIEIRKTEILNNLSEENRNNVICVVPIQMMETWLLINPEAIKQASENRNYRGIIDLPSINHLETFNNPKRKLFDLLKTSSELSGRRLSKFNVHQAVHFVAEYIEDYSILRNLSAFQVFESDLRQVIDPFIHSWLSEN
jgi:hypothetical protein